MNRYIKFAVPLFGLLSACSGGGGGSDHPESVPRPASLSLGIGDTAVDDAQHVYVQFHGVELQGPTGTNTINFDTPKQLDLLTLTGTNDAPLLTDYSVPAGNYEWIRLMVDTEGDLDSYIVTPDGLSHELTIPSGAETGLKLNRGFTLAQGGVADFTIDFDLRHSVIENHNGFLLKPTLRLVDNAEVGTLSGTVSPDLIAAHCPANEFGAVYVFAGSVVPDDVDGDDGDPLTSALVASDGSGSYTVGFLSAGAYTVAWTCDAVIDDPEVDDAHDPALPEDTVHFFGTAPVTITANMTTTLDFAP